MDIKVRGYQDKDAGVLRECIAQLHDFERTLEPDRLPGEEMADKYIEYLWKETKDKEGQIFVAEVEGKAVGIVATRVEDKDFDLIHKVIKCLYISDIAVLKEYRGKGIGRALMRKAEGYAKSKNLTCLRLGVFPNNKIAMSLYEQEGYRIYDLVMVKELN